MDTPTKQCWRCKQFKSLEDFHQSKATKDGRQSKCRSCCVEYNQQVVEHNRSIEHTYDETISKPCRTCGNHFPATPDYFHRDINATDRLVTQCKSCNRIYCRQHRGSVNPASKRMPKAREGFKYCPRCESEYPATLEYFSKHTKMRNGIGSFCKGCYLEYTREYRAKNIDKYKDANRRWQNTVHAKALQQTRVRRRRATRKALPDTFTNNDWQHALNYFNGCCAVCGRPVGLWHTVAADHWIPITDPECPGTVASNIIPLCHSQKDGEGGCNNSKSKRNAEQWLTGKFGERKAKQILARINQYFEWVNQQHQDTATDD